MGCHSSKSSAPTRPVANPAGTLLTASDAVEKSPSPKAQQQDTTTPQATPPSAQLDTSMTDSVVPTDAVLPAGAQPVSATPQLQSPQPVSSQLQSAQMPTSRVLKNPQGWQEEGILFPHEGVRFLMQEMCDAIDSMDSQAAWKWENLAAWYQEYFYEVVHHHHDAEEQIYLPWIQTRVAVPEKISADHPELMKTMDDLRDMFKAGSTLPVSDRAAHLMHVRERVHAFVEDMQQHLAEEEEAIPQLLRQGEFTQEEEGAIIGKIIEGLGLGGNKAALPPMLHAYARWAGAEKADAFVSTNLPPPIQFLYRYFWLNDFQTRHMGLIASLAEGVDTNPFASKWFC